MTPIHRLDVYNGHLLVFWRFVINPNFGVGRFCPHFGYLPSEIWIKIQNALKILERRLSQSAMFIYVCSAMGHLPDR